LRHCASCLLADPGVGFQLLNKYGNSTYTFIQTTADAYLSTSFKEVNTAILINRDPGHGLIMGLSEILANRDVIVAIPRHLVVIHRPM
jgi:hypothetical protein